VVNLVVSRVSAMILGLLTEGERHGYDLVREMEDRGMLRWAKASKVAVYKALASLEREGCLTSWLEKSGNTPQKRVYALTHRGEEMLRDLVYGLCSSQEPIRSETFIGLIFMGCLDGDEKREALERRLKYLQGQIRRLGKEKSILAGLQEGIYEDILEHELEMYRIESRWLKGLLGRLEPGWEAEFQERGGGKAEPDSLRAS
jgi:DNA-binding PadR family transcriptional regulator